MKKLIGNVIFIQPELPLYRVAFFDRLHQSLGDALCVCVSKGSLGSLTPHQNCESWRCSLGKTIKYKELLYWQCGALSTPIRNGDVVVISGAPRYLSNWFIVLKAKTMGARIVWWGHYRSSSSSRLGIAIRRFLMRYVDHILFYTDREVEDFFRESTPIFRYRVSALNNGLSLEKISTHRLTYIPSRRGEHLFFIGRLTRKARVDLLLHAAASQSLAHVTLNVVGDGVERESLQITAQSLGLQDRVKWHGALTDEAAIAEIANQCSIFVYPGSVGLSLIHAMAYGLPAVVHGSPHHHMPEFYAFIEGVTGCAFKFGDVESLIDRVCFALADLERLNQWSIQSLARVQDTFNTRDMAVRFDRMLNVLDVQR